MNPKVVLIGLMALAAGCATAYSPQARNIKEGHRNEVADCEKLGNVQGSASGFHWSTGEALQSARNRALEQAYEMDGSHVVWHHVEQDAAPRVSGTAYRC